MGRLLSLLKAAAGEVPLSGAFGRWAQAVSQAESLDAAAVATLQAAVTALQVAVTALQAQNVLFNGTTLGQILTWSGSAWIANQQALWLAQKNWYVNSLTGSDTALGDAAHPLATFSEFQRRMRGQVLDDVYTVNITGDLAELPVDFDIGANGWLDIVFAVKATSAPYHVGAFTAGSPFITGMVDMLQTTELGSAATVVGKRMRFITGAANQCTSWAAFSLAPYVDDHSWEMTRTVSFTKANGTWVFANPAPGDQFVVDTLPVVSAMSVHIRRRGGQGFCFAIRNAQFGTQAQPLQDPIFSVEGWGYTVGCMWWTVALQTDGYHVSDGGQEGSTIRGLAAPVDKARFLACYWKGNVNASDIVWWHSILAHGALAAEAGELHVIGMCGILNDVGDGVVNGLAAFNSSSKLTVSTDGFPAGYLLILFCTNGINIPPGCLSAYVLPAVSSTCTRYAMIGATPIATSAGVPFIEPASSAGLVVGMLGDVGT